jgi:hypothetical protein
MCPGPMNTTKVVADTLYEIYRAMGKKIDAEIPIAVQGERDMREGKLTPELFNEKLEAQAAVGRGGSSGCNVRMVKSTAAPVTTDWQWDWLPSYQTIVAVHEEELRKRVTLQPWEEYMFGLSRYLAEQAERGNITAQQLVYAFNTGWKWMLDKTREESILLVQNLQAAQLSDAATWKTVGEIAVGLAAVTTAALLASAAANARATAEANARAAEANAYRPAQAPTSCYAYPGGGGRYYIYCY